MSDDFDDRGVGISGEPCLTDFILADMAPFAGDGRCQANRGIGSRIVRTAGAIGGEFSFVELG